MKWMIVDDHAGVRNMIRQLVSADGDAVCECASADEAVRVAGDFQPDFVTMDVRMPGLSAFKAVRTILESHPPARVVVVTSYDQPELRRAATEAGAIGYVGKENLDEIRRILNRAAAANGARNEASPPISVVADLADDLRSPMARLAARIEELELFPVFIANELRSQVQTISSVAALLQRPPAPLPQAETQACARRITEACAEMSRRIESLLGLVNASAQASRRETVVIDRLVNECWLEICPASKRESIAFRTMQLPDVKGDPGLLRVLFRSLLDNAVKFSASRPTPVIEVNCCSVGGDVVFAISDNGVGFDRQQVQKLFLPVGRLHSPEAYPGVGLGLALARRIVEQHGGRIWADATLDQGAIFYFTLPGANGADGG